MAINSIQEELPQVFAANGNENLEAITRRFFDDTNNHKLLPELIRNVRGLNRDYLLVRASAFYKYTGLGFRTTQLVDRAADKARDCVNNNNQTGARRINAELAIQLMYEGAKVRRGAVLSSDEGIDNYGPIDHAHLVLEGASKALRHPVSTLEERTIG